MSNPLEGLSVCVGMPCGSMIPFETVRSMVELTAALKNSGVGFSWQWTKGSSIVQKARSEAAWEFLKSDCNRLFWIDSDIAFRPADFLKLLALSQRYECVGASYAAKLEPPTLFINFDDQRRIVKNQDGLLQARSFGLGFTCVHRKVIEQLAERAPKFKSLGHDEPMPHIFRCEGRDGEFFGEDILFFDDVRALGYSVWLDPTITLGHVGDKEYRAEFPMPQITQEGAKP